MDVDVEAGYSKGLVYPRIAGYRVGEQIGGGGFSRVFRAVHDEKQLLAACKIVNTFLPSGHGPNLKELQKEVQVHRSLQAPSILAFLHSEMVGEEMEEQGICPGLYILLELAVGGDLFDKIAPEVGIPEDLAKFYFAQLHSAVEFIHSKGVAHRDLKPENLLLAANGNLKLSDFGLCAVYKHKGKERALSGRCGSMPYVAPELGSTAKYAAEPVDVWGMGIVLFTMLVGNTPWDEPSETSSPEFHAYLTGELWHHDPWSRIKGPAQDFLRRLLTVDPAERIRVADIPRHPWCMTPSQLTREMLPEALTQGLRTTGMMAYADPTFTDPAAQAYAAARSQRKMVESNTQMNAQESQFMRATGNLTQGGDVDTVTTRFWLRLGLSDSFELVLAYLRSQAEEKNIKVYEDAAMIRVLLPAGQRTVKGVFKFTSSDTHVAHGQTLVSMRREAGSILHWRSVWWAAVRNPQIDRFIVKGDEY